VLPSSSSIDRYNCRTTKLEHQIRDRSGRERAPRQASLPVKDRSMVPPMSRTSVSLDCWVNRARRPTITSWNLVRTSGRNHTYRAIQNHGPALCKIGYALSLTNFSENRVWGMKPVPARYEVSVAVVTLNKAWAQSGFSTKAASPTVAPKAARYRCFSHWLKVTNRTHRFKAAAGLNANVFLEQSWICFSNVLSETR
jgi:hypothetical protein